MPLDIELIAYNNSFWLHVEMIKYPNILGSLILSYNAKTVANNF